MKHKLFATLLMCLALCGQGRAQGYTPSQENLQHRQRFADSKLGVFFHWGLYSMYGHGEWSMQVEKLNAQEYAKGINAFYPAKFDAASWVSAVKAAGAKYITVTSRHHEGFSMWNTRQSDYNIMNSPYGKDVIKALADECHRQGIELHLYYSHLDWTRDDYPMGRTGRLTGRDSTKADWNHYFAFMNRQLTELLTQYGEIGAIWFDGVWDHEEDKTPFNWHLQEQYDIIHKLQPACLVGNNHHLTAMEGEDFQIFERDVPGENKAGYSDKISIGRLPLETCQTMNDSWGYDVRDLGYKSPQELVRLLVRTAGKGANLLLNVSPQPDGALPQAALDRLNYMGNWLKKHGETIYATTGGEVTEGERVVSTRKGNHLYIHVLNDSVNSLSLNLPCKVKQAREYATGNKMAFTQKKGTVKLNFTMPKGEVDYIIELETK
jgi:hypothetical protein